MGSDPPRSLPSQPKSHVLVFAVLTHGTGSGALGKEKGWTESGVQGSKGAGSSQRNRVSSQTNSWMRELNFPSRHREDVSSSQLVSVCFAGIGVGVLMANTRLEMAPVFATHCPGAWPQFLWNGEGSGKAKKVGGDGLEWGRKRLNKRKGVLGGHDPLNVSRVNLGMRKGDDPL